MNPARNEYFVKVLKEYTASLSNDEKNEVVFADIGCGGGLVTEELARSGLKMIGFDMSENSLKQAREHSEAEGLSVVYKLGNAYDLSSELEDNSVNGVVMSDVIEHFHDLPAALREVSRILKPGGVFVFDTLNRTITSYIVGIVIAQESPFAPVPAHLHDWSLFVKPEELKDVLQSFGIELKESLGLEVKFNWNLLRVAISSKNAKDLPFYIGKDTSVQYIGYAIKKKSST